MRHREFSMDIVAQAGLSTEETTDMVGRRVRFRVDPPLARRYGRIACEGVFEVTGLQRIYTGEIAYRVVCVEWPRGVPFDDSFGRPMRFDEAVWEAANGIL